MNKMSERTRWRLIWAAWVGYFAAAETKALRSKHPHAPLSAHLRWVLGIHRKSKLGRLLFWGFFGWLAKHLWDAQVEV